jgi:hypothetical protein
MVRFSTILTAIFLACTTAAVCAAHPSQTGRDNNTATALTTSDHNGVWSIDSTAFVNNGERGEAGEPLAPTQWHINTDGSYQVTGPSTIDGTHTMNGEKISIKSFGMTIDYTVLNMTATTMVLESYVMRTAETEMKVISYFTRVE